MLIEKQEKAEDAPKTIPYWPYCSTCEQPMSFDDEASVAYCHCGSSEWGYPRPAAYVMDPTTHLSARKRVWAMARCYAAALLANPDALDRTLDYLQSGELDTTMCLLQNGPRTCDVFRNRLSTYYRVDGQYAKQLILATHKAGGYPLDPIDENVLSTVDLPRFPE